MRCERIEIVNFCQHRYREVEFEPGLTAIIGPNGSGKSNFLGAIRFALTGDNPNVGTKLANVCDLAPATENSYVELTFTHGGVRATVRRNIRPARPTAVLTIEGGDQIEGDKEVTARINQILGIDNDIINDIVIVAQDEIFGFLDKTPAKRAEQFQKLFHTERAAVVHKLIGDQLKTVEIPAVGVDIDELRTSIQQHDARAKGLQDQIATVPGFEEIQRHRDDNAALVRQFDERANLQSQLNDSSNRRHQIEQQRQQLRATLQQHETELGTIQQASQGNEEAAQQARVTLSTLQQKRDQANQYRMAVRRVEEARQKVTELQPVETPEDYWAPDSVRERLQSLTNQQHGLGQFVASFAGDTAECPTCGTPVTSLADRLEDARKELAELATEITRLQGVLRRSMQVDQQKQQYASEKMRLETQLQSFEQALQQVPETSVDDVDEIRLRQTVANEDTFRAGLAEYQRLISDTNAQIARCDGQIETLTEQVNALTTRLAALPEYTLEQRTQANENVVGWDRTANNRREWESQITIARTSKEQCERQLAQAQTVKQRAELLRAWHEFGQDMRGVVHKDAAPRFVAQRNLRRLQAGMNESLEMFDTNYRVEADEGLSFQAMFNHGSRQPAERLSEGQKVVLALAFRLALNLMFAEDVGALYLDEPTAYLDEHHIRGFEPVLDRLKEFSAARGLQCMIITHERDLAPLFDSVIQL